jgi:hypothetical protein
LFVLIKPYVYWLEIVRRQVASLRYGVVQVVVHDSQVTQIEKTERVRLDKAPLKPKPFGPTGKLEPETNECPPDSRRRNKTTNKDNMKLNQLILATFAGMQLVFPAWAADDTATNSKFKSWRSRPRRV